MTATTSFYELLGVGPSAESETLRKAYRRLARKHHPDVNADPRAHENMARINDAFQTLIDPIKRQEYDALLAGGSIEDNKPRTVQKPIVLKLKQRLSGHKTPIYAVTFAPDTSELITSSFDNEVIWWDEESEKPKKRLKLEAGVISVLKAGPLDRLIAAGSAENQVSCYRLDSLKVDAFRVTNDEWVGCLGISYDGTMVAAGSMHRSLTVTSSQDGSVLRKQKEHDSAVTAVAWSISGHYLATGSADSSVKIWDTRTWELVRWITQIRSTVSAMVFSNDGQFLVVAAMDLSIRVFRLSDGELVKMVYGHSKPIESLAFHPNNWLFASGSRDGSVGMWNAAKGIGNVRVDVSSRPISSVAFSPDGLKLAAGGQDKLVRIWDVAAKDV